MKAWIPTDFDEMKKFIGIILCMGLVRLPKIELYWSKKKVYDYSFVCKHMKRDRFTLLLKCFHFNDNDLDDKSNKLYKIQPLLDKLNQRFKSVYSPGDRVVIGESMIPYRGRVSFLQYNPGKAHKYGLKIYKPCAPNAYTWNFQVYSGKPAPLPSFNHSVSVILKLCDSLLHQGVTVFADNFYTSLPLAEKFLKEQTYYCGTLRKCRKFIPSSLQNAKLKKGEVVSQQTKNGVKFIIGKTREMC
ncbi:piggyBac transposable element-derived protein 4-like [Palaemon carinicauda]|uniref:piggyBac transposable element-derived protein 4-like n=1 Tax=Palaemon carinicauda TaxID=392227 RepID=UPI0035B5E1A2